MNDVSHVRRSVLQSSWGYFLWSLLFLVVFVAVYYLQKPTSLVIENAQIQQIFTHYNVVVGPVLAILCMFLLYVLAGLKRIVGLRRVRFLNPLMVLLVMVLPFAMGWQLKYRENRYTDIARGIIGFFANPLLLSSIIVGALALLWLVVTLLRRRA